MFYLANIVVAEEIPLSFSYIIQGFNLLECGVLEEEKLIPGS